MWLCGKRFQCFQCVCLWIPEGSSCFIQDATLAWSPLLSAVSDSQRQSGVRWPTVSDHNHMAWMTSLGMADFGADTKLRRNWMVHSSSGLLGRGCLSPPGLCAALTEVRWQGCQSHVWWWGRGLSFGRMFHGQPSMYSWGCDHSLSSLRCGMGFGVATAERMVQVGASLAASAVFHPLLCRRGTVPNVWSGVLLFWWRLSSLRHVSVSAA